MRVISPVDCLVKRLGVGVPVVELGSHQVAQQAPERANEPPALDAFGSGASPINLRGDTAYLHLTAVETPRRGVR